MIKVIYAGSVSSTAEEVFAAAKRAPDNAAYVFDDDYRICFGIIAEDVDELTYQFFDFLGDKETGEVLVADEETTGGGYNYTEIIDLIMNRLSRLGVDQEADVDVPNNKEKE